MTRSVVALCADDFGMGPGICAGIVELAQRGRLNATSCLVTAPTWHEHAPRLRDVPRSVQRGLHFSLTQGEPASAALRQLWPRFPSLSRVLVQAAWRQLPAAAIAQEWRAQWDAFVAATGHAPDYVDGHQHVHHLPGVRETVLAAAAAAGVPVRNTGRLGGPGFVFKRFVIERSGGRALARALRARGIAHNAVLSGIYDFGPRDYRRLVRAWLAAAPAEGALLMCHPSADMLDSGDDPIAAARRHEASYLGSDAFAEDLATAGVTLGPAWRQRSSAH